MFAVDNRFGACVIEKTIREFQKDVTVVLDEVEKSGAVSLSSQSTNRLVDRLSCDWNVHIIIPLRLDNVPAAIQYRNHDDGGG